MQIVVALALFFLLRGLIRAAALPVAIGVGIILAYNAFSGGAHWLVEPHFGNGYVQHADGRYYLKE